MINLQVKKQTTISKNNSPIQDKTVVIDFNVPAEWNELPLSCILFIAKSYENWKSAIKSNFDMGRVKGIVLHSMLELTPDKLADKTKRTLFDAIQESDEDTRIQLMALTDFILSDEAKLKLTKNPLPEITFGGRTYIGPADELANIVFGEFCAAEDIYKSYKKSGNLDLLRTLCAVLYRFADPNFDSLAADTTGDERERYNSNNIKARAQLFAKCPIEILKAIELFYLSCRELIVSENTEIFSSSDSNESSDWGTYLLNLARLKNIDDELLEQKQLTTVMMEMAELKKESNRLKEVSNGQV